MKKFYATTAIAGALMMASAPSALASLARSAFSSVTASVYGVYVTSDATCQTGLYPAVSLTSTATSMDFTKNPSIGAGIVPSAINCMVVIMKNSLSLTWSAGSYTDSGCNSGGSTTVTPCSGTTVTWPSALSTAMSTIGLSTISSCSSSPTGSEIVPVYLSSNSACTGNSTIDGLLGHTGCTPDAFTYPTTSSNTSSGIAIGGGTAQTAYAMVLDPTGMIGNTNGGLSCGALGTAVRFGTRGASSVSAAETSPSSPSVSSIIVGSATVAAGPTGGGSTLTITGSGFDYSTQVAVGSSACTNVSVATGNASLTCTTPSGTSGTTSVTVTNLSSGLSTTSSNSFEYRVTPSLSSSSTTVSPTQVTAAAGGWITITGTGLRARNVLGTTALTNSSTYGAPSGTTAGVFIGRNNSWVQCINPTFANSGAITCLLGNATINAAGYPNATYSGLLSITVTNYPDTTDTISKTNQFNFF